MGTWLRNTLTRRHFLAASAATAAVAVVGCSDDGDPAATASPEATLPAGATATAPTTAATLAPTPACVDDDDVTIEQTEGPYFTPDSPERTSLREAGLSGTPLTVSGVVLTTECAPIARALIDVWQCDDAGVYDNGGFRLRGHQFTGDDGSYRLETIVPGVYPGRTRHIHVKVQPPDHAVLTTQLYFPGEPGNAGDGIFDESLLMDVQASASAQDATFDFVFLL